MVFFNKISCLPILISLTISDEIVILHHTTIVWTNWYKQVKSGHNIKKNPCYYCRGWKCPSSGVDGFPLLNIHNLDLVVRSQETHINVVKLLGKSYWKIIISTIPWSERSASSIIHHPSFREGGLFVLFSLKSSKQRTSIAFLIPLQNHWWWIVVH